MADIHIQGSFAFICHVADAETLDQAWYAVMSLRDDVEPDTPSAALTTLFPPLDEDDPWSGLLTIFDDPDFPDFGADLHIDVDRDNRDMRIVVICGMTDFQPAPIAKLIQRCCAKAWHRHRSALIGRKSVPDRASDIFAAGGAPSFLIASNLKARITPCPPP